jgi:hypothetical protein
MLPACEDRERCEPDDEIECACEDGSAGTRYCLPNRSYDQCYCSSSGPWPNPGIDVEYPFFDAAVRDASTARPVDAAPISRAGSRASTWLHASCVQSCHSAGRYAA